MTHIFSIINKSSSTEAITLALCGLFTEVPGAEGDLLSGPVKTAQSI